MLRDEYGRIHDDLRVSVTDRCNLRCTYCMPVDPLWFPREHVLEFEEIVRLVRIFARRGVRRIRLTGGEPLVRRDLPDLVRMLDRVPGIEELSLTTNGVLLAPLAGPLQRAGLGRINVSLDTLDPDRFSEMTRRPLLDRVLAGIDAAIAVGLTPLKVNTVIVHGKNEDEIETLVEHARQHRWEIRFIEYMPLENGAKWDRVSVVTGEEIRRRIRTRWPFDPDPRSDPGAPAKRYVFRDGRGSIGFIDSISAPFCSSCGRLRLTADGQFRVCLYDENELDLKGPLRGGATDQQLEDQIAGAVRNKGRGGALDILERRQPLPLVRTMHQIGG